MDGSFIIYKPERQGFRFNSVTHLVKNLQNSSLNMSLLIPEIIKSERRIRDLSMTSHAEGLSLT